MGTLDSRKIKQAALNLGADLCGIALIDRFAEAPEGFHPTDIDSYCESVIVFARRLPASALFALHPIPYSHARDLILREVDRIGIELCFYLEEEGVRAVPIPAEDPLENDGTHPAGERGVLSLAHAAYLAGLGVIGRNALVINRKFGNMIELGAILVDLELDADPPATYVCCPPHCNLCLEVCPAGALDGQGINPRLCRAHSQPPTDAAPNHAQSLIRCNQCRQACPVCLGI